MSRRRREPGTGGGRRAASRGRSEILRVIRRVRRRWRLRMVARGAAVVAAAGLLTLVVSAYGLERLRFAPEAVWAFRVGAWSVVALLAYRFLGRPLFRRVDDEAVALYLEEHEPSLEAALVTALEEARRSGAGEGSGSGAGITLPGAGEGRELVDRVVEAAVERCRAVDGGASIERESLALSSGALAAVAVAGAALVVLAPAQLRHGVSALVAPTRDAAEVNPYAIATTPGDTTVARGSDLLVTARLRGFESGEVELLTSAGGGTYETAPMFPGDAGEFEHLLLDLRETTTYIVESEGVRSSAFRIEVAELPYVGRLSMTYRYPAYTGLPPREVEEGGDIAALAGTVVDLRVHPTIPVDGGRIVVGDSTDVPLEPGTDDVLGGSITIRRPGHYRVELPRADGRLVPASPRYRIDVLEDHPPSVSFDEPGRDVEATPIEEVFVEARAADDHGVASLDLVFSVNGEAADTVRLFEGGGGRPLTDVSAGHTLFLEEWELEPGDVVSYHASARDSRAEGDGAPAARSDLYFVTVRPFREAFRQADQRPAPGGGGGGGMDRALSEIQRQVISATFNLVRDRGTYGDAEFRTHVASVTRAQEDLRDRASTLLERIRSRGIADADAGFGEVAGALEAAGEAMGEAVAVLEGGEPRGALAPEQRALRDLQKAEEAFRDVQRVGRSSGGGGGGGGSAEDLQELFDLELDRMKNQYETVQRRRRDRADEEIDETLEKLDELARRQEQEAQRRRLQAGAGSGSRGEAQRELAGEVEETARRLERLARETSSPDLEETARRLRDAADAMRRSATRRGGGGAAEAERAVEGLREARRLLDRSRASRLRREVREAAERARELARRQEDVGAEAGELGDEAARGTGPDREELRRLFERKDAMAEDVADLERRLDRMAAEADGEAPEAARRLRAAADSIREGKLRERIRFSKGLVTGRGPGFAGPFEEGIGESLDALGERLADAADAMDAAGRGEGRLDESLRRARSLARGMETMDRRLRDLGEGGRPDEVRQLRREFRHEAREAGELRRRLREADVDPGELDAVIEAMRALEAERVYDDPEEVARLRSRIVEGLKELEFRLRRRVEGGEADAPALTGSDDVPPGFRKLVEEYFRALSREGGR